jgi:hypothetical protein
MIHSISRRIGVHALVWCALLLTVAGTIAAQSSSTAGAEIPSGVRNQIAHDRELVVTHVATGSPTTQVEIPDGYRDLGGVQAYAATGSPPAADADQLPAWRWRTVDLDVDDGGLLGPVKQVPVAIAEMFFGIASLVWMLLLTVIKFGLSGESLIRTASGPMNAGFAFIGERLVLLMPLFVAVVLWKIVGQVLRGQAAKAIKSGLIFTVAMIMLSGMSLQSLKAVNSGDPGTTSYPGTPSWIAVKTLSLSSSAISPLTSQVVKVGGVDTSLEKSLVDQVCSARPDSPDCTQAQRVGDGIDCSSYIAVIERRYEAGSGAEPTLLVMSRLWQNTFLNSWSAAAFGLPLPPTDFPNEAICHWAEEKARTPVAERWSIAQESSPDGFKGSKPYMVFGPHEGDKKNLRMAMTGFAACSYVGGKWTTDEAWRGLDGKNDKLDGACTDAYKEPRSPGEVSGDFKDLEFFGKRVNDWTKTGLAEGKLNEARSFGSAFSGANTGDRLTQSILALLVAIVFLFTLGFVGVGLFVSSLMAVVGLILAMPLMILAFAFESPKAQALLRILFASLLAKAMFTLLLSALILISGLFQALISATYAMPYFIRSIGYGFAPVLALLVIKKMLTSIGMADLLSPTGALSFATSAALKASKNKSLSNMGTVGKDGKTGLQRGMSKTPWAGRKLDKLDRYGINKRNWDREGRDRRREANAQDKEDKQNSKDAKQAAKEKRKADTAERRSGFRKKIEDYRADLAGRGIRGMLRPVKRAKSGLRRAGTAGKQMAKEQAWERIITLGTLVKAGGATAGLGRQRGTRVPTHIPADPNNKDASKKYTPGQVIGGKNAKQSRDDIIDGNQTLIDREYKVATKTIRANHPELSEFEVRTQAYESVCSAISERMSVRQLGEAGPFTQVEIDGYRFAAGAALGYDANDMLVTATGGVIPTPLSRNAARETLAPDQLRHFSHWLPEEDRTRRTITGDDGRQRMENDNEYGARILATGVARGVVDDAGNTIDILAMNGLDLNDPNVKARVEKWQKGMRDSLLDSLVVSQIDSAKEERLITGFRNDAVSAAQTAQGQLSSQWTAQTQAAQQSVASLPQDNQTTQEQIQQVIASVAVVETTREMVEKAKDSGDPGALEAAAGRLNRAVEILEERTSEIADSVEDLTVRCAEAAGMAIANSVGDFTAVEKKIEEHLSQLPAQIKQLSEILEGVQGGSFNADEATRFLERLGKTLTDATHKAVREFGDANTEALAKFTQLRFSQPKPGSERSATREGKDFDEFPS